MTLKVNYPNLDILYIKLRILKLKQKLDHNNKSNDWTLVRLGMEPQANNNDIYDIKNVWYHKTKVESPKIKKHMPQCNIVKVLVTLKTIVLKDQNV